MASRLVTDVDELRTIARDRETAVVDEMMDALATHEHLDEDTFMEAIITVDRDPFTDTD